MIMREVCDCMDLSSILPCTQSAISVPRNSEKPILIKLAISPLPLPTPPPLPPPLLSIPFLYQFNRLLRRTRAPLPLPSAFPHLARAKHSHRVRLAAAHICACLCLAVSHGTAPKQGRRPVWDTSATFPEGRLRRFCSTLLPALFW